MGDGNEGGWVSGAAEMVRRQCPLKGTATRTSRRGGERCSGQVWAWLELRLLLTDMDRSWLRRSFELAVETVRAGDQPFAAVLVGPEGERLIEGRQTRVGANDCTAHAEMNVVREASRRWDWAFLAGCTLYSSTEPCLMCTGGFGWSGIGRLVFGLSQARMYRDFAGEGAPRFVIPNSCRELLANLRPPVVVDGPALEEEAIVVHRLAWPER